MKKICGVSAFKILNKTIYYNLNDILYRDNNVFLNDVEGSSFWEKKNIFYYHDNKGYHNLLNNDNDLKYHGEIGFSIDTIKDNEMICFYDSQFINGFWERNLGLFDVSQMKIIKKIDLNLKSLYFFFTSLNYYLCKNLKDRNLLYRINHDFSLIWQFSIADFPNYISGFGREEKADIQQIIGVYNNILWVLVGRFRLVGIDVETGKQMHYIEDIPYALGLTKEERYHFDFGAYSVIHLDEAQGILKAFAHRYYIEFDLNTLKGVVKKDFGEKWEESWRIKSSTYYQEYPTQLFFSGYYKNIHNPNAFGIFDTDKAEIVWYDTTKEDLGSFYNPPQANDKILAILDDKHNLLIYDKTDDIK